MTDRQHGHTAVPADGCQLYYDPRGTCPWQAMDASTSFYGSRRMKASLLPVSRKRVQRLMRLMGLLKRRDAGSIPTY